MNKKCKITEDKIKGVNNKSTKIFYTKEEMKIYDKTNSMEYL